MNILDAILSQMLAQEYWNNIGSTKDFEDPLYLERLAPFLSKSSLIMEYGCGYGRLLQILRSSGYKNLIGFDYASNMIERGKKAYKNLDLKLVQESGKIPIPDQSIDAIIMSTILCCIVDKKEQIKLISEIFRTLKNFGVLYLSDFLISEHSRYKEKYSSGFKKHREWGIYTTNENLTVRHHSTKWIMELLKDFDIKWFEQFDFKTMNQNPAKTFHCIATKKTHLI